MPFLRCRACGKAIPTYGSGLGTVKCPSCGSVVAQRQAAPTSTQATAQAENLRRWKESGQPHQWVEDHKGQWNHQDWLALLASLSQSSFWPMEPNAVGALLEEFKRQRPNQDAASDLAKQGNVAYWGQKYDEAIARFTEALAIDKIQVDAFHYRGMAYRAKGELDRAIADFTNAIALRSSSSKATYHLADDYFYRAECWRGKGKHDEAIADATEAIRLSPSYSWAYATRAEAFRMRNDLDRAIADATEAIRISPTYDFAYGTRAACYRQKGDLSAAIKDLSEAVRLNPKNEWAKGQLTAAQNDLAVQQTTAAQRTQLPPPPAPPPVPMHGGPSRQSTIAAMTGSGSGQQSSQPVPTSPQPPAKKQEPGLWHRFRSIFQPNKDKCPNCHESLAGEYVGEETIARRQRLETRPMPVLNVRGEIVGEQLQQVVVEDVVWWRYLKCKFCGHEWREKRSDTFQP